MGSWLSHARMDFVRVDPPGCDLALVRRPAATSPSKGTTVFLHGLGDASSAFYGAFEAPSLAPFEIVLVDLLGHGSSDKPSNFDYRPASHAAVLFQALRGLELPAPVHLVGYSLGGAVALELGRFPLPGLGRLVLVDPALDPSLLQFSAKVVAFSEAEFRAQYAEFLAPYGELAASFADRRWAEAAAFASSTGFYRSAKGVVEASRRGELLEHFREAAGRLTLITSSPSPPAGAADPAYGTGVLVVRLEAPNRAPMYDCPAEFYEAVRGALGPPPTP